MILLIDNYDSFSYNVYQLLGGVLTKKCAGGEGTQSPARSQVPGTGTETDPGAELKVIRNDAMTVEEIAALRPDGIVISPGPGRPADAGVCEEVVRKLGTDEIVKVTGDPKRKPIPILGICLGHQGICEAFGATITYAKELMHGKQSIATLDREAVLFRGMEKEIPVARYHSLAVDADTLTGDLKVVATADDGEVMAVEHKKWPIFGVQFHPESIMTPDGEVMMQNFIRYTLQEETAGQ